MDGWFKAVDARNGKLLWQFKTGSGIIGQPMTYRGPDGKQYVAVLSGVGGWAGAIVAGDLDAARPHRRARLRQRDERSAATQRPRAECSTLLAAIASSLLGRRCLGCLARRSSAAAGNRPDASAPRLRRSQQPAVLQRAAARIRERDRGSRRRDLHARVEYTWWAQRRGFVRKTLKAGTLRRRHGRAEQFRPRLPRLSPTTGRRTSSSSRRDRHLDVRSLDDPRLRHSKIGVQLIGDDDVNSPPAQALAAAESSTTSGLQRLRRLRPAESAARASSTQSLEATSTSPSSGDRWPDISRQDRASR